MKRVIDKYTVDFSLSNGDTFKSIPTGRFRNGTIIAAALHVDGDLPAKIINLTMVDTSGKKVQHGSTIKDWQQRDGGDYLSSMMPIKPAQGGLDYSLDFSIPSGLDADLTGQVVFIIDQTKEYGENC